MKLTTVLLFFAFTINQSFAQYQIDHKVDNFTLMNAADNAQVSLEDYLSAKVVVLIFSGNNCPYSKLYDERILKLHKEYSGKGVIFLMVNSNNPRLSPEDSRSEMTKLYNEKKYPFPYLIDHKHDLCNAYGATKTPEVFVLKNINNTFVLKYRGAIDDNPQVENDVTSQYLKDALNAILANGTIKISDKRASGCMIKK